MWRILKDFGSNIDKVRLTDVLNKKCEFRSVAYKTIDDFFTDELLNEARQHWQTTLEPFVKDLPDCESVIVELRRLISGYFNI